jgi:hypothetical protein
VRRRGPDFLGIGPLRTGSSWLYAVLRGVPGVWVPPIKELAYWDLGGTPNNKRWRRHLSWRVRSNLAALPGLRARANHPARVELAFDRRYFTGKATEEWYRRLFDAAPEGTVRGEITPGYFGMREDRVERLATALPDVRLCTTLRFPVDTAWSSANRQMRARRRAGDEPALDEVIEAAVAHYRPLAPRLARWLAAYPTEQVGIFWFDDFSEEPTRFLGAVLDHIGAPLPSGPLPNVVRVLVNSSTAQAGGPPAPLHERLSPVVTADIDELADLLGDRAGLQRWRTRLAAV